MKSRIRNIVVVTMTCLFIAGCDDTYISSIPDYPVSLQLNLYVNPYNTIKENPNHYLIFDSKSPNYGGVYAIGYGGVLVYCGFDYNYYAFDLSCPYEHKQEIKVKPNDLGQAVCEKCGTVFDIGYGVGNPSKRIRPNLPDTTALAKEVLKRYRTSMQNNYLYITR